MFSKLMFLNVNVFVLDDFINYLDLESIIFVNKGFEKFLGVFLFIFYDYEFIFIIVNRIIEIILNGIMDRKMDFDEYLESKEI